MSIVTSRRYDDRLSSSSEIEFTEWTLDGHLRHSRFVGLREHKEASKVRREGV
ncbi:MAG TPA: hypothetical protein VEG60_24895 [Candidatus Binatia bacterium]|nr:hypothetical protein [Candidatus Binatia bacterium]